MTPTLSKPEQVERALLELVADQRRQNEPLPTEMALAERLSVSRVTVRKALRQLVDDGVVHRTRGRGTFVTAEGVAKSKLKQELAAAGGGRTFSVGVALPLMREGYFQRLADACERGLEAEGVKVVFLKSYDGETFLERVLELYRQGMDGFILNSNDVGVPGRLRRAAPELRTVFVNELSTDGDSVASDDRDGAAQVVRYLISLGHRRIAHLHGPLNTATGQLRLEGYRQAMREGGLEDRARVANGMYDHDSAKRATRELLAQGPAPEAVFCANDNVAQGAYAALAEAGLRVPGDVSLVGYGNLREGMELTPPLTTVDQHAEFIGSIAADIMLKRLQGRPMERRQVLVPTSIVFRGSCAPRATVSNGGRP